MNIAIAINKDTFLNSLSIIELQMNCVVPISEEKAKLRELPEHVEYNIVTHQGKDRRMWKEEGEEFLVKLKRIILMDLPWQCH